MLFHGILKYTSFMWYSRVSYGVQNHSNLGQHRWLYHSYTWCTINDQKTLHISQLGFLICMAIALAFSFFTTFIAIFRKPWANHTYVPLQVVSSRLSSCFIVLLSGKRTVYCLILSWGRRPLPAYQTPGLRSQDLPLSNSRRLCRTKRTDSFGRTVVFSTPLCSVWDFYSRQEYNLKNSLCYIMSTIPC